MLSERVRAAGSCLAGLVTLLRVGEFVVLSVVVLFVVVLLVVVLFLVVAVFRVDDPAFVSVPA